MRKTSWYLFLIVTLVLIAGSLTTCARDGSRREIPQAVQGTLDLTTWNFAQHGPVPLNGEWEFYWQRHLKPADLAQPSPPVRTGFIDVPGIWNGYTVNGQILSGDGYATYRLKVLLGQLADRLAFKFLDMATAFSVDVNGRQLFSSGVPGKTPSTTVPRFHPQVVAWQPVSDHLDIVIRVANFHHRKGGVWEAIRLGEVDDIRASRERALILNLALTGSIVIMGLYHLGLFALRPREWSPLYFGLFCLLIALRTLTTGERYLMELMPVFDWEVLTKITYLTFYLGVFVFTGFVHSLFPQEVSKNVLYLIGGVSVIFSTVVLILPARLYTHTLPTFEIVAVMSLIYGLYALILASIRKREGALVFLTGFVALSLTTLNDILYANLLVPTGYLTPVGLFIFIFSQAWLLAQRFSKSFLLVDQQRLALTQTNRAYEQEIHEREQAEAALRQSESALMDAQRLAHIGNWEWDIQTGQIHWSEEVFRLFGLDPQDVSYDLLMTLIAPDDKEIWERSVQAVLNTDQPLKIDYRIHKPDGDRRWLHCEAQVVRDAAGQPVRMFGTFQDITERKRWEAARLQTSRLESIGVLAGGIAHEFNNVLTVILGFTDLATRAVPRASSTYHHLQAVLTAGYRAKELVQQILAFSRQSNPERQPVSLPMLVREGLNLVRATMPTTIVLKSHIDPDAGGVLADPTNLQQILLNLCANAEYGMRQTGGILEVSLTRSEVEAAAPANPAGLPPGSYVRLTVRDTGDGMPPEVVERIFEPFFTTKGVGEGTGMGLAIVHGIVTSYGGAVTVESIPGEGSTFIVDLPRMAETVETVPSESPEALPQGHGCILFVDDEEPLVRLGRESLEALGYEVVSSLSSVEALGLFQATPQRFDLVITDQTMPVMTGERLARELRRIRADIPIVLCTGFSPLIDAERAAALGISAFCLKPVDIQELARTIERVLGRHGDADSRFTPFDA